ncbi:MAG: hypothetical protein AAGC70_08940 [Pseudomonadota bacterium]
MTRRTLNRTLRAVYVILGGVLLISAAAKLHTHIPGLDSVASGPLLVDIYEYLKDMSLVFITVIAAYLANIFQKRTTFVDAVKHEWRGIVATKLALVTYCEKTYPTTDDYLEAYCHISGAIDNMRIVYRNVGETDKLIGLYPYSPLHDMRRALETIDPRANPNVTQEQRTLVRTAVEQTFYALRERFLDELDLEEPTNPLTAAVASRIKVSGTTRRARRHQDRQRKRVETKGSGNADVDGFLWDLYYDEVAQTHAGDQRFVSNLNGGRDSPQTRV